MENETVPHKSAPAAEPDTAYAIQIDAPTATPVGDPIKTGGWDAEFCGCFTHLVPNCCMATCCPCVSMAQIAVRLGIASYPVALLGYLLAIWFAGILHCLCAWHLRATIRDKFQIPGSCCGDCLAACCCSCCVVAQMATHVKSYKPGNCDFGPPDTLPGFR
jgi:Cys-rich protein (TIGR01571 family)